MGGSRSLAKEREANALFSLFLFASSLSAGGSREVSEGDSQGGEYPSPILVQADGHVAGVRGHGSRARAGQLIRGCVMDPPSV